MRQKNYFGDLRNLHMSSSPTLQLLKYLNNKNMLSQVGNKNCCSSKNWGWYAYLTASIYYSVFLSWLQNLKWGKTSRRGNLIQAGDGWGEMLLARCRRLTKGKQLILRKRKVLQGRKAGRSPLETPERVCCLLKGAAWARMSGHVRECDCEYPQLWKWPCRPWCHSVSPASGSR